MEKSTHPEKTESFVTLRRNTTVPLRPASTSRGRWEVERYLQAGGLSVVQPIRRAATVSPNW